MLELHIRGASLLNPPVSITNTSNSTQNGRYGLGPFQKVVRPLPEKGTDGSPNKGYWEENDKKRQVTTISAQETAEAKVGRQK
eukprot:5744902-Amphidinium_carterae.1